jgi:hypothetical protein
MSRARRTLFYIVSSAYLRTICHSILRAFHYSRNNTICVSVNPSGSWILDSFHLLQSMFPIETRAHNHLANLFFCIQRLFRIEKDDRLESALNKQFEQQFPSYLSAVSDNSIQTVWNSNRRCITQWLKLPRIGSCLLHGPHKDIMRQTATKDGVKAATRRDKCNNFVCQRINHCTQEIQSHKLHGLPLKQASILQRLGTPFSGRVFNIPWERRQSHRGRPMLETYRISASAY